MLTDLIGTIEMVRARIRDHRSYLDVAAPEARTRVSLIDPLLRALEWDVGDPSLVAIEWRAGSGRADYALQRRAGEPVLLLEAKKLSDTNAHHEQLARYVVGDNLRRTVKIPYCAITNGNRWQVFDVFRQELVVDASLEDDEPRRCALKLLALWQPTLRESTVEPVSDLGRGPMSGVAPSPSAADPCAPLDAEENRGDGGPDDGWMPLDSEALVPSGRQGRMAMRFPDGSTSRVESWIRMLVKTAEWLFETGLLRREEVPFAVAGRRCCVSTDGQRPDGERLKRPLPIGQTGLQLEGSLAALDVHRFTVGLLKRYGIEPSRVSLKLES